MIIDITFGTNSTWIFQRAWIQTFTVVTLFVVRALVVILTSKFEASKLSVTRKAWITSAHRYMVGDVASCILATITWVGTQLVDTRF
jgi:hypothetical protein